MRLADRNPGHCAACYSHKPGVHVDFEAAYDGPYFGYDEADGEGLNGISVEQLIVCEDCVRASALLIGMLEETPEAAELKDLRHQLEASEEALEAAESRLSKIEGLVRTDAYDVSV